MQAVTTRREYLYDIGSLSFSVAVNDTILKKIIPSFHSIGLLIIERHDWFAFYETLR